MDETRCAPVARPAAVVCRAIEIIQAESAYSQHRCAPAAEARRLGLRAERFGAAALVLTRKSEAIQRNRVMALGQASPATPSQLDRVVAAATENRSPVVAVLVGAATRPAKLPTWLEHRGFAPARPIAKLWRDASPLTPVAAPRDVAVRRVRPPEAALWVDVMAQVWRIFGFRRSWYEARVGVRGWHHYIAWIGAHPAGAASLFVGEVGALRAGHLYEAVTLKRWRRRGVQRALIRKRLTEGRRLGCQVFTSETAPPLPHMPMVSFRNLRRQGFELAYLQQPWKLDL